MKRQRPALGRFCARLARDETGGETLEYALTLGFMAVACYVLVQAVGLNLLDFWQCIDRALMTI